MNQSTKIEAGRSCPDGLRNRFSKRKRMLAEDFQIKQYYLIGRRRLFSRSIAGLSMVHWFAVKDADALRAGADEAAMKTATAPSISATEQSPPATAQLETHPLRMDPGLALDIAGREIVPRKAVTLTSENTPLLVMVSGVWRFRSIDTEFEPGSYMLAVHHVERFAGETVPSSFCCCDEKERTHLCETLVFTLCRGEQQCGCAETPCPAHSCAERTAKRGPEVMHDRSDRLPTASSPTGLNWDRGKSIKSIPPQASILHGWKLAPQRRSHRVERLQRLLYHPGIRQRQLADQIQSHALRPGTKGLDPPGRDIHNRAHC